MQAWWQQWPHLSGMPYPHKCLFYYRTSNKIVFKKIYFYIPFNRSEKAVSISFHTPALGSKGVYLTTEPYWSKETMTTLRQVLYLDWNKWRQWNKDKEINLIIDVTRTCISSRQEEMKETTPTTKMLKQSFGPILCSTWKEHRI